jgi:hypothetical protein
MAANSKVDKTDPISLLARSVDLLLRVKVEELRADKNQTQMIHMLGRIGMTGPEIASVLGADYKTVAPILSKSKAKPTRRKGQPRGKRRER